MPSACSPWRIISIFVVLTQQGLHFFLVRSSSMRLAGCFLQILDLPSYCSFMSSGVAPSAVSTPRLPLSTQCSISEGDRSAARLASASVFSPLMMPSTSALALDRPTLDVSFHLRAHRRFSHCDVSRFSPAFSRKPALAKLPAVLEHLREHLKPLHECKPPHRKCDRAVKARPARYGLRYLRKDLN